ncbi:DUF2474 family protein [Marinobacterium lutimaris]|nr:DUF2474 family protein [Marinobacterium lutimaris]
MLKSKNLHQLLWLVAIWSASVSVTYLAALILRALIPSA